MPSPATFKNVGLRPFGATEASADPTYMVQMGSGRQTLLVGGAHPTKFNANIRPFYDSINGTGHWLLLV
ncbi:hypothetical protein GCM10007392_16890 [Saccharospirillum salsuginis]|uniref:Uncharacterized protein n=1 Tax=Saccharospirillum salsuginis TaxID=418750 RepID=A0A918N874_9GAMM|nr:hypothetical protein GCM10007392_16890 [Saccharospirillum salsuginis]